MQIINQLINIKNNYHNLAVITLFTFLPISFIVGNAAINFNILFIDLLFLLYCIKSNFWGWIKSKTFLFLITIYIFLILNSLYSFYFIIEDENDGLIRSLLFIKFILLVFSFSKLLENEKVLKIVQKNWLVISLFVIFDIFYEKYFGKNLFGYVSPTSERVISFFKDEMVVGGYILCFGFSSMTFFLNENNNKKKNFFLIIIFLIIPIAIFLTGERSNFIKSVLMFFILLFFLKDKKFFFSYKYLASIFLIIISTFFFFSENIKNRYYLFFERIIIVDEKKNILDKFENIRYVAHFETALKIFKNYPISGVGNKNYRKECSREIYFDKNSKFSTQRCSTHPHQIHFEILSEQGIVGYLLIIYFIGSFLLKNIKIFIKSKNINHLNNISYISFFLLPLLPGAGIFSTFNGSLFWVIFSITYLNLKNSNSN